MSFTRLKVRCQQQTAFYSGSSKGDSVFFVIQTLANFNSISYKTEVCVSLPAVSGRQSIVPRGLSPGFSRDTLYLGTRNWT